jgi:RNA ligase (TIGR02306 family)
MGLVLPLKVLEGRKFPNDTRENPTYELTEGSDVTALLGVTKWEPVVPACLSGDAEGPFPTDLLPKTDEERIQSCPEILTRYPGVTFVATEKIDGSSCTLIKHEGQFRICGRNWEFKDSNMNSFRQVAVRERIDKRLPEGYALQGELAGPGIQGNPLKLERQELFFFNVSNLKERRYLGHIEFVAFCSERGFKTVPTIFVWDDISKWSVDDMVVMATEKSFLNPNVWAEGMVIRPMNEMKDPDLGRLSYKVINPEYLLLEK